MKKIKRKKNIKILHNNCNYEFQKQNKKKEKSNIYIKVFKNIKLFIYFNKCFIFINRVDTFFFIFCFCQYCRITIFC
jgi:hypothetical protein